MNILSRFVKKKQWYVKCTECGQEITGLTENHCIRNFHLHFTNKHPELDFGKEKKQ